MITVSDLIWKEDLILEDILYSVNLENTRITVLDRLTGYGGNIRDIESGYRDEHNNFWLASGGFDIRQYGSLNIEDAILLIKKNANTCIPE